MTTTLCYKSYSVETCEHTTTFPNMYWESENVPLYGCEQVSMAIIIYPFGASATNRGNVGIYVRYYCEADITLQVQSTILVKIGNGQPKVEVYAKLLDKTQFGQGFGSPKIFPSSCFAEGTTMDVSCTVSIKEFVVKRGGKTITTTPAGSRVTNLN